MFLAAMLEKTDEHSEAFLKREFLKIKNERASKILLVQTVSTRDFGAGGFLDGLAFPKSS